MADMYRVGGRLRGPGLDCFTTVRVDVPEGDDPATIAAASIAQQYGIDPDRCFWQRVEIENVSTVIRACQMRAFDPCI